MTVESFLNGRVTLHPGDCLAVLDTLAENSVDSVVCDPPYHLTSIVKRFGATNAAPCKPGTDGAYARASAGFMGKAWDGGDIAFRPETWAKMLRVLKPGSWIVVFSSSRTFGRMSVALEDAGFITHPMIGWIFGSGFPKAHRITADGYEGFRYGGQAMKPALEPIYLGQKPFSESTGTANVLRWGVGALNIAGCRVGYENDVPNPATNPLYRKQQGYKNGNASDAGSSSFALKDGSGERNPDALGRWPANLIHDGSDEVIAAFPETVSGSRVAGEYQPLGFYGNAIADRPDGMERGMPSLAGSAGSAARFFYAAKPDCRCDLCGWRWSSSEGKMPSCDAINATSNSSTRDIPTDASALDVAVDCTPHENVVKNQASKVIVRTAAAHSSTWSLSSDDTVHLRAAMQEASRLGPVVRSASSLCGSCETVIAQSLAATRLGLDPASVPCPASMPERSAHILRQHLALYVEGRENTGTILTTASLKTLFGSVFHAIAESTSSAKSEAEGNIGLGPTRWFYSSKAKDADRLGSRHPTVKPLDLIQYLVRLVTPPKVRELVCQTCDNPPGRQSGGTNVRQDVSPMQGAVSEQAQRDDVLFGGMPACGGSHSPNAMQDVRCADAPSETDLLLAGVSSAEHEGLENLDASALQAMRRDIHADKGRRSDVLFSEVCGNGDGPSQAQEVEDSSRLHSAVGAREPDGVKAGLCDGTPSCDGEAPRARSAGGRSGASHKRGSRRQQDRKSSGNAQGGTRPTAEADNLVSDPVSVLRGDAEAVQHCAECGGRLVYRERPGVVLDCFSGTGTTGEAAFREGMRAILIEREPEYQADIRRRMALCLAGPDERRRATIKAKGRPDDLTGTLFAPPPLAAE